MTIPAQFLDQLRDRTLLSALVGKTVPLKKAGREFKACCPFHNEKGPSFHVNDEKGFYHCFGCGAHGDAIRWMTDHNGMTFIDAVKELAAAAGMEVPAADPRQAARDKARDSMLDITTRAQQLFERSLKPDSPAGHYLKSRNFDLAQVEEFGIGYAPKVAWGAEPFAAQIGANPDALVQLGVLRRNPDDGRLSDFFRDRITIPIHDARGRVIGWGGRIIGKGEPKYLNTPETPLFDKGRTLFNLHRASPAARAKNRLIVVEGYMDVIGMASAGVTETVAPNGTAMTEHQMALCWKLVDQPILCFDGDKAGKAAAFRAAERALPVLTPGKDLAFVYPPEGQDPDDVARKGGADAVADMLASRMSIADIIWSTGIDHANSLGGGPALMAGLRKDFRDMIETIKDADVKAAYYDDFGRRFDRHGQRQQNLRHRRPSESDRKTVHTAVDDAIFKGVIMHIDRLGEMGEAIAARKWSRPVIGELLEALLWGDDSAPVTRADLTSFVETRGLGEKYRVQMSHETLRFPFLKGPPSDQTFHALMEAIRAPARN